MDIDKRSRENGLILGLIANCVIRRHIDDCPLRKLVHLPLDEQIASIEMLSRQEIAAIIEHHRHCAAQHLSSVH